VHILHSHSSVSRLSAAGDLRSNGNRIYGYDYVRKSATSPAALVVNEEQAAVVRSIFEIKKQNSRWISCNSATHKSA
jgi:hypothetical protein